MSWEGVRDEMLGVVHFREREMEGERGLGALIRATAMPHVSVDTVNCWLAHIVISSQGSRLTFE